MTQTETSLYFLTSPRLGWRHWTSDDTSLARGLWGDPDVTRYLGGPWSDEQVMTRLEKEMGWQSTLGHQYWPMFDLATDAHVGVCGVRPWGPSTDEKELGFHLRPEWWHQGLASEAAQAIIGYAFGTMQLPALFAGHHPELVASAKILLKLGFVPGSEEFYPPTGLMHPTYRLDAPSPPPSL